MTITAKYEDGVFKPLEDVTISEGTLGDFAFSGMWKDRADLGDSIEYVSKLRR